MRAFVRAALEEELGCDVLEAASGLKALSIIPREPLDLLLVDVNMPDLNGLELVAFMRKREKHQDTPIILMSTEAAARDRDRGVALGASAFLEKPFTPEQLIALVRELLTDE